MIVLNRYISNMDLCHYLKENYFGDNWTMFGTIQLGKFSNPENKAVYINFGDEELNTVIDELLADDIKTAEITTALITLTRGKAEELALLKVEGGKIYETSNIPKKNKEIPIEETNPQNTDIQPIQKIEKEEDELPVVETQPEESTRDLDFLDDEDIDVLPDSQPARKIEDFLSSLVGR